MQKTCDLFIPLLTNDPKLKYLSLFDNSFKYDEHSLYEGYLNLNIKRIKLIHFVSYFRTKGIHIFNVPIEYRDNKNINKAKGTKIAQKYANDNNFEVCFSEKPSVPLYWAYRIINDIQERVGGMVYIDKLDGHIWTIEEYEEYFYDYNNIL